MTETSRYWVVVSGGSGALGLALALHFSRNGHRVLSLDRAASSSPEAADLVFRKTDLLSEDEVRTALTEAIPAGDRISLLINAVGLIGNEPLLAFRGGTFQTHSVARWQALIDANLTAPFVVAAQVAARMARRGGGAIVNFSSIAGAGHEGQSAYSAAKAGIEGLTRTMAAELGPLGIRTNAVALGFIDVPTTREAVAEERLKSIKMKTPLGRLGSLDDVIRAVAFLHDNAFVNGDILKVDGGLRL